MNKSQWYIGAPNGVILCVNRVDHGQLAGLMYHSYSAQAEPFSGIEEMTHRMERLYDALRFPFPGTSERSFGQTKTSVPTLTEGDKVMADEKLLSKHGDLGTFIVRVQHRQNSSWQGRITWMEENKTLNFRSVWEMIKLIESAVDTVSVQEEAPGAELTWSDQTE